MRTSSAVLMAILLAASSVITGCQSFVLKPSKRKNTTNAFDKRQGHQKQPETLRFAERGPAVPSKMSAADMVRLRAAYATVWVRGGFRKSTHKSGKVRSSDSTSEKKQPAAYLSYVLDGVKNGVASGLSAACVKALLQPFDTMKTVQQYSTSRISLLEAGRDLIARGGVGELYQGLAVTLVGSMPSVALYFGLYQYLRNHFDERADMSHLTSVAVSAGVGNCVASGLRVPYEVVKQRLQVGAYPNTMIALTSIYRQGGIMGFFGKSGLTMQLARDVPYAIVTLLVYESLQKIAARHKGEGKNNQKTTPLNNMLIGAVAGGVGSLVTNPMDMVKTRMATSPELYAGPLEVVWMALRKEGPQAFMKGSTPRLLHKIPANGLFFVAYEFFRTVLGVKR